MTELYRSRELEALAKDGAIVVLKIDGERKNNHDMFTVVLSGGRLRPDDFFRMDGSNFSSLIDAALNFYNERTIN